MHRGDGQLLDRESPDAPDTPGPTRAAPGRASAYRNQNADTLILQTAEDEPQDLTGGRVDPLQVVEREDDGRLLRAPCTTESAAASSLASGGGPSGSCISSATSSARR